MARQKIDWERQVKLRDAFILEIMFACFTVIVVFAAFLFSGLADKEIATVTRDTASKTQLELTQHHYFDSCVFLVLTAGGVERTPVESRDVIRKCADEGDSLTKPRPVDDVLREHYPDLFEVGGGE